MMRSRFGVSTDSIISAEIPSTMIKRALLSGAGAESASDSSAVPQPDSIIPTTVNAKTREKNRFINIRGCRGGERFKSNDKGSEKLPATAAAAGKNRKHYYQPKDLRQNEVDLVSF